MEVATPARDRGIDLIAYADLGSQVTRFSACPIQLKAAIGGSFSVDRKYVKFPNLLMAYVWYLEDPAKTVTYATTYPEAVAVADVMGYTKTPSWEKGLYVYDETESSLGGAARALQDDAREVVGEGYRLWAA